MNIINSQKATLQSFELSASALAEFDHLYLSSLTAAGSCITGGMRIQTALRFVLVLNTEQGNANELTG